MAVPLTGYERLIRHNLKKKDIRDKAAAIVNEKIRPITKRDKVLYNGLFSYPVIKAFANKEGLAFNEIIIIMLLDLYPTLSFKEAQIWGFEKYTFAKHATKLIENGYILSLNKRSRSFYPLQKGKDLIKEFNKYYDEHVKKVFRSLGKRDNESLRKVTRIQPARIYKPRDQSTGPKPTPNGRRKNTGDTHRP